MSLVEAHPSPASTNRGQGVSKPVEETRPLDSVAGCMRTQNSSGSPGQDPSERSSTVSAAAVEARARRGWVWLLAGAVSREIRSSASVRCQATRGWLAPNSGAARMTRAEAEASIARPCAIWFPARGDRAWPPASSRAPVAHLGRFTSALPAPRHCPWQRPQRSCVLGLTGLISRSVSPVGRGLSEASSNVPMNTDTHSTHTLCWGRNVPKRPSVDPRS